MSDLTPNTSIPTLLHHHKPKCLVIPSKICKVKNQVLKTKESIQQKSISYQNISQNITVVSTSDLVRKELNNLIQYLRRSCLVISGAEYKTNEKMQKKQLKWCMK